MMLTGVQAWSQELLTPATPPADVPDGVGHRARKSALPLQLPFFDDFAGHHGAPDAALWSDRSAYINTTYAAYPPTIGMATLDAVDEYGELHSDAGIGSFPGDTLTSNPIRLDSILSPYHAALTAADSVVLSFFYLPGGGYGKPWECQRIGDMPDRGDSLIVDFYNAQRNKWTTVKRIDGGIPVDSLNNKPWLAWQYVAIAVADSFFSDKFQFRFRNKCSLDANSQAGIVGNTDQWNIDVVQLTHQRSAATKTRRDIAFVNPATSLLKEYTAMPYRHYAPWHMRTRINNTIVNRYHQALPTEYHYYILDENGTEVHSYDGGSENVLAFYLHGSYQTAQNHNNPPVSFHFPAMTKPCHYTILHVVRDGFAGDNYPANDTTAFRQEFSNYFAYDDGSAENGYGLTSTSNRMKLACRFHASKADTLTSVDLYFNHTRGNENTGIAFHICVWAARADGKPDTALIYRSKTTYRTSFCGFNRYCNYSLDSNLVLKGKDTNFYIGIEQIGNKYINLGFDRNNDNSDKTYYWTSSNEWQQSILGGTVMMRPRMGTVALLGTERKPCGQAVSLTCYPNPTTGVLHIATAEQSNNLHIELYNLQGQRYGSYLGTTTIDMATLPPAIYLLRATTDKGSATMKIVKK
ncbi:MAG: T9SS type A sorting domain-containing protein [Bacteroidales bacterium]|nr:T9SS type A sorting domain-containing protein [Bacteroidales bacterium]